MKTFTETSFRNFKAWSGAVPVQERIILEGKEEEFDSLIEELYPDGINETALNDLLWFDSEWVFESLGMAQESEDGSEEESEEESSSS